ncbi:MAG: alpha/beta hydrolase [Eubacterium sp.]|nr:alpha/beta hydrolase [Eubacterium sp.]
MSDVSRRGNKARQIVGLVNHLPGISAQSLRTFLSEHEKDWNCPEGYSLERFRIEQCYAEMIRENTDTSAGNGAQSNELRGNGSAPDTERVDAIGNKTDKRTIVYQLHGGGYAGRLQNAYRDMAIKYSGICGGADVLSLDYRVSPENPFPAAVIDAEAGYKWILEQGYDRIILVGDSAGGGLALSLTLYLRDNEIRLPDRIITMSAWTDLTGSGESYAENRDTDPVFGGSDEIEEFKKMYIGDTDPMNPYISPIFGDFTGFPDTLMQVGELEMLLSDTLLLAERMNLYGVNVTQHTYPGMFHDFQKGLSLYPESKEAWDEISEFLSDF